MSIHLHNSPIHIVSFTPQPNLNTTTSLNFKDHIQLPLNRVKITLLNSCHHLLWITTHTPQLAQCPEVVLLLSSIENKDRPPTFLSPSPVSGKSDTTTFPIFKNPILARFKDRASSHISQNLATISKTCLVELLQQSPVRWSFCSKLRVLYFLPPPVNWKRKSKNLSVSMQSTDI